MKLTVMQHADAEDLGVIKEWAADQGIETVTYRPDQGDPIAQLNPADIDGLIVLGGPMSVNDDLDWLAAERILIRSLNKLNRPVLGRRRDSKRNGWDVIECFPLARRSDESITRQSDTV